jgi:catechol 2,3-dioxygenase-like lactoylglutathione lyase family enzyme
MADIQRLRGFSTISYWAADLEAAKQWYAELLGIEPYFERPGYAEFRLGDYQHELGLIDSRYSPGGRATEPAGAVMHWHVNEVAATLAKLVSLGAKEYEAIQDRGQGFHHCFGGRPVRQHPGHHVQPALFGSPELHEEMR